MNKLQSRSVLVGVLLLLSVGVWVLSTTTDTFTPLKNVVWVPLAGLQSGLARAWGGVTSLFQRNPDLEAAHARIAELETTVAQLQSRVVELQEAENDLQQLNVLVNYAGEKTDNIYLAANVIGFDTSPFLSYIFLDRGSNDDIRRDMPVVTAAGLVGRVVEVTATACKVLLITDPDTPVNARVLRSRATGVVVGQTAGSLTLQYLAQEADVQPGDVVMTSGLGGKYPEGLVIGAVTVVQRQDYEVQQTAVLVSPIDFRALEMALILTSFKPIDFEPFSQPTPAP